MEKLEHSPDHQVPRGGPIYLQDLVGPLIRVPNFEFSLDEELRSLEAELNMDSSSEYDLSVDELKVLSEEELVNLALKEALQVEPQTETPSQAERVEVLEEVAVRIETTNGEGSLVVIDGEPQKENPSQVEGTEVLEEVRSRTETSNVDIADALEEENYRSTKETSRNSDALVDGENDGALREKSKNMKRSRSNSRNEGLDERDGEGKLRKESKKRRKGGGTFDKDSAQLEKDGERQMEDRSQVERPQTRSRTAHSESQVNERSNSDKALRKKDDVGENSKKRAKARRSKSTEALGKKLEKRKKRGRLYDRETRAAQLENPHFIEKIEQLARIKKKQDEDKIAARLHSFNGGSKVNQGLVSSPSENVGKMKSLRFNTKVVKKSSDAAAPQYDGQIARSEMVLCVEIYTKQRKTQELLVLGNQKLSDLRDHIYCSTDELMQKAGKHDPSGYFLIEEVFCNDKRDPGAIDYSEPILDWLRNSKNEAREKWERVLSGELQQKQIALLGQSLTPPLPQFKAVEMHRIRFCDVAFRLGAGYLYCHQGGCKHLLVMRDMRRIHPEDVQDSAAYPVVTFHLKTRYRKCDACKIYQATKVTVDDKWAQENPCYFCDNCYYLLHYAEDGSLLYSDFTVHDYHRNE